MLLQPCGSLYSRILYRKKRYHPHTNSLLIYLDVIDYNERFSERVIRGFGDLEVKKMLNEMFETGMLN
ncbi:hypothetical protein PAECIP111892_02909 [Paenibacillus auburnensis]|uniref:Uncharacterized protein n=1 Tax=Paenibacillus auburnensis TaxID=2905649 RepID=A0ABN8GEY0_9BACL|nr:hypothetical protein PAECIP111892_02909 [Paenibacillus auburnensis]